MKANAGRLYRRFALINAGLGNYPIEIIRLGSSSASANAGFNK
jgi:hypothetical protein